MPAEEPLLMSVPFAAMRRGRKALVMETTPKTLTAKRFCAASVVVSVSGIEYPEEHIC